MYFVFFQSKILCFLILTPLTHTHTREYKSPTFHVSRHYNYSFHWLGSLFTVLTHYFRVVKSHRSLKPMYFWHFNPFYSVESTQRIIQYVTCFRRLRINKQSYIFRPFWTWRIRTYTMYVLPFLYRLKKKGSCYWTTR